MITPEEEGRAELWRLRILCVVLGICIALAGSNSMPPACAELFPPLREKLSGALGIVFVLLPLSWLIVKRMTAKFAARLRSFVLLESAACLGVVALAVA